MLGFLSALMVFLALFFLSNRLLDHYFSVSSFIYDAENPYINDLNTYIEKENLLCNSEGLIGYYYDNVYSIKDGVLTLIDNGEYWFASEMGDALDENGEPLYEYSWNGTKVSKEEYEQDLRAIYDTDKAKEGYQWDDAYSAEKIIEVLEGMK